MNIPFVAAAGNFISSSEFISSANCKGVITITRHDRSGNRFFESGTLTQVSSGKNVDISAPAAFPIVAAAKKSNQDNELIYP